MFLLFWGGEGVECSTRIACFSATDILMIEDVSPKISSVMEDDFYITQLCCNVRLHYVESPVSSANAFNTARLHSVKHL